MKLSLKNILSVAAGAALALSMTQCSEKESTNGPVVSDSATVTVTVATTPDLAYGKTAMLMLMSPANQMVPVYGPIPGTMSATGTISFSLKVRKDSLYNYSVLVPNGTMTALPPKHSLIAVTPATGLGVAVHGDTSIVASTWMIFTNNTASMAPYTPPVTYSGKVTDAIMAAALGAAYTGTTYAYKFWCNDSFQMTTDVMFGPAVTEAGTYAVSGSTYSFTPVVNWVSNPTTHQMQVATTNRAAYTGAVSGNDITITAFVDVGGTRVIGNLTVTKQ